VGCARSGWNIVVLHPADITAAAGHPRSLHLKSNCSSRPREQDAWSVIALRAQKRLRRLTAENIGFLASNDC